MLKQKTQAHKQNELCAVMAVAIQFGLKYSDIYGIRSDKNKLKEKEIMFLNIVFPPGAITKQNRVELLSYLSSYVTL